MGFIQPAKVVFGPDGNLYGATTLGGGTGCGGNGCGTIFSLKPPPKACTTAICPWTETVLYRFAGGSDAANPYSELVFDQAGDLYGTAAGQYGGYGYGTVFKLTPSGGGWTESVLYSFKGGTDGWAPSGVILDSVGNLYGTTYEGGNLACDSGYGCGVVFELAPSGSGWIETTLYSFQDGNDGGFPMGGLIFDQFGNLYGATSYGGAGGGGTVFELSLSMGKWTFSVLYGFAGPRGGGPQDGLVRDAAGSLYGTTVYDGAYGEGGVFKLTLSGDSWVYTPLHDFMGSDGSYPQQSVVFDADGDLYSTTFEGGTYGDGVVWEITP